MNFSAVPVSAPRRGFIVSILLHCTVIVLLGTLWASSPTVRQLVEHTTLVVPWPEAHARPLSPKLVPVTRRPPFVLPRNPLPAPAVVLPTAPMVTAPGPAPVTLEIPPSLAPAPPAPPKQTVRTDVFASVTAPPVVNFKPALPLETDAFQVSVANQGAVQRKVTKIGVFDAAERQNAGRGASIVKVAASGFGDAQLHEEMGGMRPVVARPGDAGFGALATANVRVEMKPIVRESAFDSGTAVPAAQPKGQTEQPRPRGVEILVKPRPAYTEEARKLKIEGEVLLEVLFTASGEVKVLRVAKGLGHGLDEAAAQAAANIRFKPAERDGISVDSAAVAHITFQLAY